MAFLAAGLKVPSSKPTLQTSGIFNYIFDKDVLKKKQLYLWNWDPKYKSIRITLYSNLNPDKFGDKYGLTVEMISSYEEVESTTVHEIWSEMIKLEVIPKGANLISGNKQIIPNTFPIPTVDFSTTIEKQSELFNETFRNGKLLGRSSGKAWFITEIFRQTYESLKDL